jgi:tetratricopeptide (TPR) repeat protein/predicted Ser/Thr protein kinase
MTDATQWFTDPGRLLERVRQTQMHWGDLPRIAGYDELIEKRHGGHGVIYRARQRSTNRTVAIKVLRDGLYASDASRLRFEREAVVVASLRHPNIVRVHDSGVTEDGRMFCVMEWVEGKPLDDPGLEHVGDVIRTLTLCARICDAVQYAHQRGVIHRDLKPSNILIEENGEPQVLDFGLAKIATDRPGRADAGSTLSHTGQFLGSIAWAGPEQIDGAPDRIDIRTDVYALGVILFQLLTGRLPHPVTSNLRQTLNDITTAPPPRLRALRRDIPEDVETIVLRCLAKEPDRRYPTVGDLAADLRRFVAGEPIDAKRDRKGYVLRKTLARHKLITTLGAALLVSVLGFAVTMAVLYPRALNAEQRARANLERARTQTEKAEAVRRFLHEMLSSVDPGRDGRDVRIIDILERAAEEIDSRFEDQPEVKAALRATIGLSYRALGMLDTAGKHLVKALRLRMTHNGEDHRETLISLNELAVLRIMQGKLAVAEKLLKRALETGRRRFGEDDALMRYALSSLAGLRNMQGRFREAEALLRRLLAGQLRTLGESHANTIRTINNLAVVLCREEKKDEALVYCRRALKLHTRVHGPDHVHTVRARGNLGDLLMERGDLEEAEPLLLGALEDNRRLLGNEHPETINAMHNVAVLRRYQGRHEEALSLARGALEAAVKYLPRGHLKIARYRNNVGACLMRLGRLAEAERELLNAHRALCGRLGDGHPYTKRVVVDLIKLYASWNKPAQSAAWRARLEKTDAGARSAERR